MEPIVLFGIQFTLSLVVYSLIAFWYVAPRLSRLPRELALVPLLWVHAFRTVGGTILAPGRGCRQCAHGIPNDDRIWRPDNGIPCPAGTGRPSYPPPRCARLR